jgi:hypothetical protein
VISFSGNHLFFISRFAAGGIRHGRMHGFCPPPLASQSFAAALSSFYHPVKVAAATMVPAAANRV